MSLQIVSIIVFTVADKLVSGKMIMNSQIPCIYMSWNLWHSNKALSQHLSFPNGHSVKMVYENEKHYKS